MKIYPVRRRSISFALIFLMSFSTISHQLCALESHRRNNIMCGLRATRKWFSGASLSNQEQDDLSCFECIVTIGTSVAAIAGFGFYWGRKGIHAYQEKYKRTYKVPAYRHLKAGDAVITKKECESKFYAKEYTIYCIEKICGNRVMLRMKGYPFLVEAPLDQIIAF